MIAAFMPRHFGFCLSVGLELSGFEFKSSLNLEQVCKNQKMKKGFYFLFFTRTSFRARAIGGLAPHLLFLLLIHARGSVAWPALRPALEPSLHRRCVRAPRPSSAHR